MLVNSSVTVAAADTQLALLATIKTELGISGTAQDVKLTRILRAVGRAFAEELGREPWLQTYSDKLPGNGGTRLYLPHWPCQGNPSSVTVGTGSSPDTVDADTYSVGGRRRNYLERVTKWKISEVIERAAPSGAQQMDYTVVYTAGWVLPTQVSAWVANTAYASGAWVSATDTVGSSNVTDPLLIFQSGGGTSHASTEPTWPTVEGGTVTDNDITWTAHRQRLPEDLEEAAMKQVMVDFRTDTPIPAGFDEIAFQGERLKFSRSNASLSPPVLAIVRRYR